MEKAEGKFWTKMTLCEFVEKYAYVAECPRCMHSKHIEMQPLIEKFGADFPVVYVRPKLVCECGNRAVLGGGIHLEYYKTHMRRRVEGDPAATSPAA